MLGLARPHVSGDGELWDDVVGMVLLGPAGSDCMLEAVTGIRRSATRPHTSECCPQPTRRKTGSTDPTLHKNRAPWRAQGYNRNYLNALIVYEQKCCFKLWKAGKASAKDECISDLYVMKEE